MIFFKNYARQLTWLFMALLLPALVVGCGDGNGGSGDTTAPTVTSVVPVAAATGVPTNIKKITATFSEAMDLTTITGATFTVTGPGTTPVSGIVDPATATFAPTAALTNDTLYTATVTTGAKDIAGNALVSPYVWNFTSGATSDIIAPTVSSTIPSNGAIAVAIGGNIAVTFSEQMDASTVTNSTMTLKQGTTAVPGGVTYVGTTATFNPTGNLAANKLYTATITTGAKDLAGNALAADKTWSFTTGTTADTTAPTVSSTLPANSATGVAVNFNITATFSEAMDPSTVTTSTMTLKQGTTPVLGAVTSTSTTNATFNPTSDLAANTTYTATITTGVKDLAGNQLAVAKTWTFTTVAAAASGPQPVDLGTAANYVILAKSAISTVPTSSITGDIAVSPAAATYITGFTLIADAANVFSTSTQVTGKIYAADYATPTPSNLTTAVENMLTAYNDAAGRPTPDFTNLHSGLIGGKILVPGLYKWSTGVLIDSDVTLNGGPNDVWIFQIDGDVTQANATQVILAGGALPKNIFWQVAGGAGVDIGTTAHFEGVILAITKITLNTGASVNGRLLAQTAVTLKSSTVVEPAP